MHLTYAFCTYNRVARLDRLVAALRAQTCPVPFEILAVDNNSTDGTADELARLAALPGVPLRWVTEREQGIVPARNRAIAEALDSDIFVFIDDDELPRPGLLDAAVDAIANEDADCAGGRIEMDFDAVPRPDWLGDELLGFLGAMSHGNSPFWINTPHTPVWAGNIAYATRLFRDDPALRFDPRYSRVGKDIGGGEDAILFRTLLARGTRIRYRPDMVVRHAVEPWRLTRRYFLALHYRAGLRRGQFELPTYPRTVLGIPPFLASQCVHQGLRALAMLASGHRQWLRQGMNATHAFGLLQGYLAR